MLHLVQTAAKHPLPTLALVGAALTCRSLSSVPLRRSFPKAILSGPVLCLLFIALTICIHRITPLRAKSAHLLRKADFEILRRNDPYCTKITKTFSNLAPTVSKLDQSDEAAQLGKTSEIWAFRRLCQALRRAVGVVRLNRLEAGRPGK